jgi:hypothetical protein
MESPKKIRIINDMWISCFHCGWSCTWYSDEPRPVMCARCKKATDQERAARKALVDEQNRIFLEKTRDLKIRGLSYFRDEKTGRPKVGGYGPGLSEKQADAEALILHNAAGERAYVLREFDQ